MVQCPVHRAEVVPWLYNESVLYPLKKKQCHKRFFGIIRRAGRPRRTVLAFGNVHPAVAYRLYAEPQVSPVYNSVGEVAITAHNSPPAKCPVKLSLVRRGRHGVASGSCLRWRSYGLKITEYNICHVPTYH